MEEKLDINISEEMAEGTYSNCSIVAHSTSEFVFDFIRVMPGVPKAKVKSRVIMTPEHAKRLLISLSENIKAYEGTYGVINIELPSVNLPKIPKVNPKGEA